MAQPHPSTVPSTRSSAGHPGGDPGSIITSSGVTQGLASSVTATSPHVSAPVADASPRLWSGRRGLILAGCAVLGIVIGVSGQRLTVDRPAPVAALTPSPSPTAPVPAQIVPVAASGSSFPSLKDGTYKSQTYADANFGNYKKGIGLRLDLGTARPLTAVTFTAPGGPITVELRAGDTPAKDGTDYPLVGTSVQANGATTLPASTGGSHRYWMIWVTKLSPTFQARIAEPVARG